MGEEVILQDHPFPLGSELNNTGTLTPLSNANKEGGGDSKGTTFTNTSGNALYKITVNLL